MPNGPEKVDMLTRLTRNLGLLQAGSAVTIDITTPAGQKGKFRTTFIGYLPKKYVLIQYPDANKLGAFSQYIVQGAAITVRGILEGHEGSVVAFVGLVKQTLQIPSRLIVLDFPTSVGLQCLRKSIRIDTEIESKIKIAREYWQTVITDISINGCQLLIENGEELLLVKNKQIEIIVEDFHNQEKLTFNATICNSKQQPTGVSLGVKFNPVSKDTVIKLLLHLITFEQ